MRSGILLAIAFDSYVAICDLLRHTSILTPIVLVTMLLAVAIRAIVLIGMLPILIKRLRLFLPTVTAHSYCENIVMVKIAAEDI